MAKCPVCSMMVNENTAPTTEYKGTNNFCLASWLLEGWNVVVLQDIWGNSLYFNVSKTSLVQQLSGIFLSSHRSQTLSTFCQWYGHAVHERSWRMIQVLFNFAGGRKLDHQERSVAPLEKHRRSGARASTYGRWGKIWTFVANPSFQTGNAPTQKLPDWCSHLQKPLAVISNRSGDSRNAFLHTWASAASPKQSLLQKRWHTPGIALLIRGWHCGKPFSLYSRI